MAGWCPRAASSGQDDVPIEDGAHVVGNRLVHVVAFHQHAVDRGNRPPTQQPAATPNSRGSCVNTEGVYPRKVGGLPVARPTSRCAIANRVIESTINRTDFPVPEVLSHGSAACTACVRTNAG